MKKLAKLKTGDKVAIISPSFAASAVWPHVHELGLKRIREVFELEPVMYPITAKLDATLAEKANDLVAAFSDPEIKAVISTLGGDIQVTYIKNLPSEPFINNPKPFFGYSDNSHFANFLFLNGIPSFYGAALFTQFAHQKEMNPYTVKYIKHALFDEGEIELVASESFNDIGLDWGDKSLLDKERDYEVNEGWSWDGCKNGEGLLWGGCVESVDEMLRHAVQIPSLEQFEDIVLMMETSEEIPSADYVMRFFRALGERGTLERVKGVCVGRAKAREFNKPRNPEDRAAYRKEQQEIIVKTVRAYNKDIPIVQNMDFGHTEPQIPMPYGNKIRIDSENKQMFAQF
ncbi:MAG: Microcin C7 self-immunity protein MccF [Parcubacteria bacterium OLB19]|nr:MAG: Microcin C7 self-immunity protein MccF [Parcubacteria bacterium OLB19]